MIEGLQSLSAREIEVLRLLLAGHDAKSVARVLDLSVHTVNERLRNVRRKLGVASSREAARLWADHEQAGHNLIVDKKFVGSRSGFPPALSTAAGSPLGQSHALVSAGMEQLPQVLWGTTPHSLAPHEIGVPAGAPSTHHSDREQAKMAFGSRMLLAGGGVALLSVIAAFALLPSLQSGGSEPVVRPEMAQIPFQRAPGVQDAAAPAGLPAMDLMPIADTDGDGKVTAAEYAVFSEQGWGYVSQGKDRVKLAELDQLSQMAFFGINPDADGVITRQMYIDAIPGRFRMFDQNGDQSLSADELNGRAFQG